MQLTLAQTERYSRHIVVPSIGPRGQQRLLASRVAIAPANRVGRTAATQLAASGVGHIVQFSSSPRVETTPALTSSPDCRWEIRAVPLTAIDRTSFDAVAIATEDDEEAGAGFTLSPSGAPVFWARASGSTLSIDTFGPLEPVSAPAAIPSDAPTAFGAARDTVLGVWLAVVTLRFLLDLGIDTVTSTWDLGPAPLGRLES